MKKCYIAKSTKQRIGQRMAGTGRASAEEEYPSFTAQFLTSCADQIDISSYQWMEGFRCMNFTKFDEEKNNWVLKLGKMSARKRWQGKALTRREETAHGHRNCSVCAISEKVPYFP